MKKKRGIIIALVCVIIAAAAGSLCLLIYMNKEKKTGYEKWMEAGKKDLAEGNYEEAISSFKQAIEMEPEYTDAYIGFADASLGADFSYWKEAVRTICDGIQRTNNSVLVKKALEIGQKRSDETEKREVLDMVKTVYPELPEKTIEDYWNDEKQETAEENGESTVDETKENSEQETGNVTGAGNLAGNINNGGYVVENETYVVYSYENALWRMNQDGSGRVKLFDGSCSSLNLWENQIYFLAEEEKTGEYDRPYKTRTPYRVGLDGDGLTAIGVPADEGNAVMSFSDYYMDEYTAGAGYRGFTVYDGYLYYIGRNGREGTYTCANLNSNGDQTATVTYHDNASLYRMDLDGGNVMELAENLGNASPQMCISDGKLYYTVSYYNCFFGPYNFTKFYRASLDGTMAEELPVHRENNAPFTSDYGSYTEYVLGIQVSDGKLYLSCGDSEGEFPDSRFHVYDASKETFGDKLLEERSWVGTVASDGKLYAATGGRVWGENGAPLTNRAMAVCGVNGQAEKLLKVFDEAAYGGDSYFNEIFYEINVTEDWVYYRMKSGQNSLKKQELGRISKDGTKQEFLYGN
ncbi:DUF5050 domain-containing protein [Qiania dongpingensis]|uniref:DUF5050 domain-containing protein n=1 Tax=Qiania dongpingensis TaxID=2763669 RepID=A0A7G9G478_9FIRM|nr:DUF5050 domain-containing protein [Qiania dongpingensis]QNM05610.1 DUF5050 domain-containing protein [Qiania dongpingensis]